MSRHDTTVPEFSRSVDLGRLGPEELEHEIEATPPEREALAARFGLLGVESLRARAGLRRIRGGRRIGLRLHLRARVVQSCVVTLVPVENVIDEAVEIFYEPVEERAAPGEVVIETSADAEPFEGDSLDIGEIAAEELAVLLDPYPRAPGAAADGEGAQDEGGAPSGGPFQALERLKRDV